MGLIQMHFIALSFLIFFSSLAKAQLKDPFIEVSSAQLYFESPEQCGQTYRSPLQEFRENEFLTETIEKEKDLRDSILEDLFSWVPKGTHPHARSLECTASVLEKKLMLTAGNPSLQAQQVRDYFDQCGDGNSKHGASEWWGLLKIYTNEYNMCAHPHIRKFRAHLPSGEIIRGMLGLQPGTTKRPLIILKCGVFCNAGQASMRTMMMHLFDESPFNVMLINSNTGADYIRDNRKIVFGGLDEGMQLINIARFIKKSPLNTKTSDLHLAGVSLGGQASLYASQMVGYYKREMPPVSSILAVCPVVDLEPTMKSLFREGMKGDFARSSLVKEAKIVMNTNPDLGGLFGNLQASTEDLLVQMASNATSTSLKRTGQTETLTRLRPYENVSIETLPELWHANNFLSNVKETHLPTLAFASYYDWVVPSRINTSKLEEQLGQSGGNLNAIVIEKGNHCAFDMTYGWDIASAFFRGYFLSHSHQFSTLKKAKAFSLAGVKQPSRLKIAKLEAHYKQEFKFREGHDELEVIFTVFNGYQTQGSTPCSFYEPLEATEQCHKTVSMDIPLNSIQAQWARIPINEAEAQSLTRWANNNLRVVDSRGEPLGFSQEKPAALTWDEYE